MKALFKHLSAITQEEPGTVANHTPHKNISVPFLSTTLLAIFLGVPQVPIFGSSKAIAQTPGSCPAGTAPETLQLRTSDNLSDLTQEYNIGGIRTIFNLTEEFPGQVIDQTESRVSNDTYGGIPGNDLRLNIGPGKPPETGNLPRGSATLTITFAQPVTLASPLTLLDVDRNGARDNGRIFQDVVTVTASSSNSNVPVTLQALGQYTQISGNTASGIVENSLPSEPQGNVSITPGGAVDQIRLVYRAGTEYGSPGQDQTIGLSPFTICAPVPNVGTIGDTVYRDTNGDRTQNPGEEGIAGTNLTLTGAGSDGQFGTPDDSPPQTTTTDANGRYSFPNLPAGNYRVIVDNPPNGLTATQTPPQTIVLEAGGSFLDADFGYSPSTVGSIGDTVYTDRNRNNVQDEGEAGLEGATVTLIRPGADGQFDTDDDDRTQTTTTNATGTYSFTNLPAGNYRVTATSPREGDTATQTQPNTIALTSGQNINTVDFGFVPGQLGQGQGSIGDTVYNDTNRNNTQDAGETGIPGVTVTLDIPDQNGQFGTPNSTTRTIITDQNGNYSFPNLAAGNYRVRTTTPNGLTATQTQPNPVTLAANQNLDTVDFGFAPQQAGTGSLGDTVYNDTNSNNQQDPGETGIPGVTVTLTNPGSDGQFDTLDDSPPQTTTTNQSGNYSFPNLPAGNYRVTTTTPNGLTATQTQPDTINLQSGQTINTIDFGFAGQQSQGTGTIGDTVYNDINGNNQQDPGEPGIAGVIVNYAGTGPDRVFGDTLEDDDTSGRTRTDANGRYTFPNLPAGIYRVTINDQSQQPIRGLRQTQTPTGLIDLSAGQNFEDADFGYTQSTGTIGDTVYRDNNSDGTQNQGEPGIPNVVVTLTRPGAENLTTTTDANGRYSFPNIPTGNYTVTVNTPPEGLSPTQAPQNPIALQPGQNFDIADFGFSPSSVGTIGDFVFYDNNGDRTPNADESGIPGLTLILRDGSNNVVATTNTREDGSYSFVAPPGTYTVAVSNPPQGLTPTLTQPNPVTLQPGQNIDTVDFGFQPPTQGSIGDTVFADVNGNGIQDQGEPGVSGATIKLIRPGQDGVFGTTDDQITEQNTDNTTTVAFNANTPGRYTFDNLPPGRYQVQLALPDGSILTSGTNPFSINLQPNQNLTSADFGIRMTAFTGGNPGSIGDEVFNDRNGNGVRDEGEPGVPNVPLTLTLPGPDNRLGTPDDTTRTTTTNDQGIYTFDQLPPGPYRVTVTPPLNLPEVTNPGGSQIQTTLQPGQSLTNVDFGLRRPEGGSIGDTVFNDTNGNGVQDYTDTNNNGVKEPNEEGEPGIPGIQLTLRDSGGNIFATTSTNNNGNYTFNGLPLGNYTVESARPSDFTATTATTLSTQLTAANPNPIDVDFGFRPGLVGAASGPANLRLVKRITNVLRGGQPVSGVPFNQFEDDPSDRNDNVLQDASPQSSPVGIIGSQTPVEVQSGDEVEYTIYFLSEGATSLNNVRVCDLVPNGTTLVPNSASVTGAGTGAGAGEIQPVASPGTISTEFQNICGTGDTAANGAVLTNLGTLPAGGQFGFVRFRVTVN